MKFQEFRTWQPQVVFQEVPNHVSLAFTVSGCPLRCEGCHSQDTWAIDSGKPLSNIQFSQYLNKYKAMITCVLFLGGEWSPDQLISKLTMAQQMGFKTCLYSGFERLPKRITQHLDFLKTGPWISHLGGLDQPHTNQTFINVNTGEDLTYIFQHNNKNQKEQSNARA
jgi:anaerobic ribonucleoside-triphosphate reductase activating protein